MKKVILVLGLIFSSSLMMGQVGVGTLNPNASAELEVKSTNRGVIIPRVNLVDLLQLNPIIGPGEESLLVYNLTVDSPNGLEKGYYYWKDNKWERIVNVSEIADLVAANETVTTLVDNNDGTYTYTSENGTVTIINVPANVITTLTDNGDGTITYVNEAGTSTIINIADFVSTFETVTTLVNNNNGTYTYTSENGTVTTINVPNDVINNFSTIVSNVDVLNQLIEIIQENETITTLTDNGDGTITYVNEAGTSTTINIADLVTANETVTTLVNNNNGTYTYTSENGTVTTINVPNDVINNFSTIVSNVDVLNQLIEIIQENETITTLTDNGDGTITYVNEAGTSTTISIADLVAANETITTLTDNGNGTFTYINEAGTSTTVNFGGANNWKLNGNTVVDTDFLGSVNAKPLHIKTNNVERVTVKEDGMVGVGVTNPLSTFSVNGSVAHTLTSLTANYTATTSDYALVYKHTTAATLTLPSAATNPGRVYLIINHGNVNLTISPALQMAYGYTTTSLSSGVGTHGGIVYGNRLKVQSDGTNWVILEN